MYQVANFHQLQSSLVRAGLSMQGAMQVATASPVSSRDDRELLASIMARLIRGAATHVGWLGPAEMDYKNAKYEQAGAKFDQVGYKTGRAKPSPLTEGKFFSEFASQRTGANTEPRMKW